MDGDGLTHNGGCVRSYPERVLDQVDDVAGRLCKLRQGQGRIAGLYPRTLALRRALRVWYAEADGLLTDLVRLEDEQDVQIGLLGLDLEAVREGARGHLAMTGGCRLAICRRHTVRNVAVEDLEREPAPAA